MAERNLSILEEKVKARLSMIGDLVFGAALGLFASSRAMTWQSLCIASYLFGVLLHMYLLFLAARLSGGGWNRYRRAVWGGFLTGWLDGVRIAVISLIVRWMVKAF